MEKYGAFKENSITVKKIKGKQGKGENKAKTDEIQVSQEPQEDLSDSISEEAIDAISEVEVIQADLSDDSDSEVEDEDIDSEVEDEDIDKDGISTDNEDIKNEISLDDLNTFGEIIDACGMVIPDNHGSRQLVNLLKRDFNHYSGKAKFVASFRKGSFLDYIKSGKIMYKGKAIRDTTSFYEILDGFLEGLKERRNKVSLKSDDEVSEDIAGDDADYSESSDVPQTDEIVCHKQDVNVDKAQSEEVLQINTNQAKEEASIEKEEAFNEEEAKDTSNKDIHTTNDDISSDDSESESSDSITMPTYEELILNSELDFNGSKSRQLTNLKSKPFDHYDDRQHFASFFKKGSLVKLVDQGKVTLGDKVITSMGILLILTHNR